MLATSFARGYRLLLQLRPLLGAVKQHEQKRFPPLFFMSKSYLFPVFWCNFPVHAISQTKSVYAIDHQSMCVLLLVPDSLARVLNIYVDVPKLPRSRQDAGRSHW